MTRLVAKSKFMYGFLLIVALVAASGAGVKWDW